ncbi:MAG: HAD hydrolase-like protein [Candidatus Firestonebacteria bacterium]|nr:HAD hydrolase-like protein [Candidatus Firestonebacteria bacterium]
MKSPLVLLFDVDGTLIRTDGAGVRAFNRGFFEVMGWENALGTFSAAGMTDMAIAHRVARWFRGSELEPEEMRRVFDRYLELLPAELAAPGGKFRVLEGIQPFLEKYSLRGDILIGLGTGNLEAGARLKLEHGGIADFFKFGGYGSDALNRDELLAVGMARAAAHAGTSILPERVVVIGDTPLDIAAGRAVGAKTLAVATGPFKLGELQAHAPDAAVADFQGAQILESCLEAWL